MEDIVVDSDEDIDVDSDVEDDEDGIFRECNAIAEDMVSQILEAEIPLSIVLDLCYKYPLKSLKQEVCIKWCLLKLVEIKMGSPLAPIIKGLPIKGAHI
jgi:hypothetical protein